MMKLTELSKKSRRCNRRLLKRVLKKGTVWIRGESDFRMAERLHKAGLIVAQPSKWSWSGRGNRPFRELELHPPSAPNPQLPNLPK